MPEYIFVLFQSLKSDKIRLLGRVAAYEIAALDHLHSAAAHFSPCMQPASLVKPGRECRVGARGLEGVRAKKNSRWLGLKRY